ncbi:MAG: acyl carrier protein [Bacilli bacterium]
MEKQEIFQAVVDCVKECYPDIDSTTLTPETVINTETAIDSMGFILIICKLEAKFRIKIPDRTWNKISTINDLMDVIDKKTRK